MKYYNVKRISTKNYEETYIKSSVDKIPGGEKKKKTRITKRREYEELSLLEQSNSIKQKRKYYKNKRFDISRLIDCNLDKQTKFITLTFRDNEEINIKEYTESKLEFDKFIKRLRRYLKKEQHNYILKYIAVHEIQEKREAYHFHIVIFGMKYLNKIELSKLWGLGFVKINIVPSDVYTKNAVGIYISKYFWKDETNIKYQNKYFSSRNLKKPKETHELIPDKLRESYIEIEKGKEGIEQVKEYTYKRPKFSKEKGEEIEEVKVTYIRVKKSEVN